MPVSARGALRYPGVMGADNPNTGANAADVAERDAEIWILRMRDRWTPLDIAHKFGISRDAVAASFARTSSKIVNDAAETVRQHEMERLDALDRAMQVVIETPHFLMHRGSVVRDENGEPMLDDGPKMAAAKVLLDISRRRAALVGADSPVKVENRNYDYTINGVAPGDLT